MAVWYRIAAELRARARGTIGVVLLIGLGGGIALAAFAGARRTETAYPRFLRAHNAPDVLTFTGDPRVFEALGVVPVDVEALRRSPLVEAITLRREVTVGLLDANGEEILGADEFGAVGPAEGPPTGTAKVVEGRLPAGDALEEVAIGFWVAESTGIEVGDRIRLEIVSGRAFIEDPASFTAAAPLGVQPARVVGIVAFPGAFPPNPDPDQYLVSEAFVDRWGPGSIVGSAVGIRLREGATAEAMADELQRLTGGGAFTFLQRDSTAAVQRSIRIEAAALRIFGGLAALAAWLIAAQAVHRLLLLDVAEYRILRALGMTPRQARATLIGRVLLVAAGGTTVAVLIALAISAALPFGLAGVAEPSPGPMFDGRALGVGAAAFVGAVLLGAVPAMFRMTSRPLLDLGAPRPASEIRPSRVAGTLAAWGGRPPTVAGVRMALEPGRGQTAVPVRTVVFGLAVAVAALVAALGVRFSLDRLLTTPHLYGWDWDAAIINPYVPGIGEQIEPVVTLRDDVAAYTAAAGFARVRVTAGPRGRTVGVAATEPVRGSLHPVVVAGRWPTDTDEIALGSRTMRDLGVSVGDEVDVSLADRGVRMRVVGRAVFPPFSGPTGGDPNDAELGLGVGMTIDGLRRLDPEAGRAGFLVRFAAGTDSNGALASMVDALGSSFVYALNGTEALPEDLESVGRIDVLPVVLVPTLGLLAAATLVHALLSTTRRRRRDVAILQALGFVSGQVRRTVVWQAVALTLAALGIGIPLGVAGGRWLWRVVADRIGFVPEPVTRAASLGIVAGCALLAAVLVALIPAGRAARAQPAVILRSE